MVSVCRLSHDACVPPDHMVYLVESLTVICHFCMIDSSQQVKSDCSLQRGCIMCGVRCLLLVLT